MSVKASTWAWEMPLKGTEKLVLLALADHANDKGECWPHIEKIAEKCGVSRSCVIENLTYLHSLNLFSKETVYDNFGKRKGNYYTLNLSLSPDLLRSELLRTDLLRSKNTPTKSRFTPSLSPDSGRHIIEPSLNHHRTIKSMSETDVRTPSRFDEFWKIYPRREKKKNAREVWSRKKLDKLADTILADVEKRKRLHGQWLGGFIPHASTYLNGHRWEDEIIPASQAPPKKSALEEANRLAGEEFLRSGNN